MWHEARRQEKKLRKVIVDYKKRSERRHQYYERIKQDPTKFLQVHGRKLKIHLDGSAAVEADNNNHMMPWQGDTSNMIDRFDVRTHLDCYRETPKAVEDELLSEIEQKCNFESYRVLIWNQYKKISERQHLKQIFNEEQFPELASQQKQRLEAETQKKILSQDRACIAYDYEDNTSNRSWQSSRGSHSFTSQYGAGDDDSSEENFDILQELEEIPPLSEISIDAVTAMDEIAAKNFGLSHGYFGDCLVDDQNHVDQVSAAKTLETEKRKLSGRKSRKERRLVKDELLKGRPVDSLSYICRHSSESSGTTDSEISSSDSSEGNHEERFCLSQVSNKIEYITSFGGECSSTGNMQSQEYVGNSSQRHERKPKTRSGSPYSPKNCQPLKKSFLHGQKCAEYSRPGSCGKYHSSSSSQSTSRESRSSQLRGRERDSSQKLAVTRGATDQGTNSLMKSLTKYKTVEEKAAAIKKLTPQQKLRIKMQRALNKQLKVDRTADMERRLVKRQELLEREGDLREISRKIRLRENSADDSYKSGHF